MELITRFLKALFNFIVGDWIILGGVALTLLLVALLESVATGDTIKQAGGFLFIIGLVITLTITLRRETH